MHILKINKHPPGTIYATTSYSIMCIFVILDIHMHTAHKKVKPGFQMLIFLWNRYMFNSVQVPILQNYYVNKSVNKALHRKMIILIEEKILN